MEKRPAGGIYQHIAHATDNGYRIIEIWDDKAGLELFLKDTLWSERSFGRSIIALRRNNSAHLHRPWRAIALDGDAREALLRMHPITIFGTPIVDIRWARGDESHLLLAMYKGGPQHWPEQGQHYRFASKGPCGMLYVRR